MERWGAWVTHISHTDLTPKERGRERERESVCVCVCVCIRERKRAREKEGEGNCSFFFSSFSSPNFFPSSLTSIKNGAPGTGREYLGLLEANAAGNIHVKQVHLTERKEKQGKEMWEIKGGREDGGKKWTNGKAKLKKEEDGGEDRIDFFSSFLLCALSYLLSFLSLSLSLSLFLSVTMYLAMLCNHVTLFVKDGAGVVELVSLTLRDGAPNENDASVLGGLVVKGSMRERERERERESKKMVRKRRGITWTTRSKEGIAEGEKRTGRE